MSYDYYGYDYGYYDNNLVGSLFGGSIIAILLIGLLVSAFGIFVMWKIFEKAGKPGWIALVPFYNTYTLFEITWGNGWMFLTMFLAIIPIIGSIALLVIMIMTMSKLSKAFGKDTGFTVGLIFLSVIFMAILAFDSSTYLGVPGKENTVTQNPQPNPNQYNNMSYNQQPMNQPMNQNNGIDSVTPQVIPNQTTQSMNNQNVSFCSNCGTSLTPETTFCPNCGTPKTN